MPAGDDQNAAEVVDTEAVAMDRGARLAVEISPRARLRGCPRHEGLRTFALSGQVVHAEQGSRSASCIMDREANHRYRAVSSGGTYRGVYQMNRGLARGATFMMQKEVKTGDARGAGAGETVAQDPDTAVEQVLARPGVLDDLAQR